MITTAKNNNNNIIINSNINNKINRLRSLELVAAQVSLVVKMYNIELCHLFMFPMLFIISFNVVYLFFIVYVLCY